MVLEKNGVIARNSFGLGLRPPHYECILESKPQIDFFEILTENYFVDGGRPLYYLDRIRERYPVVMHGVSLSLGNSDPLSTDYLSQLKQLIERAQPLWISDHLCWTGVDGHNTHDLLPLPFTKNVAQHVIDRIKKVQDYLGETILIENISSYLQFPESEMTECEFLTTIANNADCLILLDINNLYVNAHNHHFDPDVYLAALPKERVHQIHLSGHSQHQQLRIDTHDAPIIDPVWTLYRNAIQLLGVIPTLIERDDHIPALSELLAEMNKARRIAKQHMVSVEP